MTPGIPLPRLVCAWCQRVLRYGDPGQPISHGICEPCRLRVEREVTDDAA